jgi:hypothetical protein
MESPATGPDRESDSTDLFTDFKKYQEQVTASLVAITRSASSLANQDLSFHRTSSEQVSRSLDRQNAHLLRLTNKLLKSVTQDSSTKPPQPKTKDDIEDNWSGMVDVFDGLLEKADGSLDEYTGAIKRMSPAADHAPTPSKAVGYAENRAFRPRYSRYELDKPQLLFDRKVNNQETKPFKPLLVNKPHAIVPLEESLADTAHGYVASSWRTDKTDHHAGTHIPMQTRSKPMNILQKSTSTPNLNPTGHLNESPLSMSTLRRASILCYKSSKLQRRLPLISNITTCIHTLVSSASCRSARAKRTGLSTHSSHGERNCRC